MTTKSATAKPKNDAFAAIHSAGAVNKTTMREYDALCLDSIPEFNARDINIKGNDYRLVVSVAYRFGAVYIKFIGTHAQYDATNAETIELE